MAEGHHTSTLVYAGSESEPPVQMLDSSQSDSKEIDLLAGNNSVVKAVSNISDEIIPHQTAEELIKEENDLKDQVDDGSMTPFFM